MLATIPRTIDKTTRFDDALEDIPTMQTYSSTDRRSKISAEVLEDRFRIVIDRSNATIKSNVTKMNNISYTPNQQEVYSRYTVWSQTTERKVFYRHPMGKEQFITKKSRYTSL